MKQLLHKSVVSAGIKIGSACLTFLMFLFLARALGPTEYGQFATMFSLGTLVAVAALFAQHTLSIKVLSGMRDDPQAGPMRRRIVVRSYLIVIASTLGCVSLLLVLHFLGGAIGLGISLQVVLGASALILPYAMSELVAHQYRAFGSVVFALVPRDILWRGSVTLLCFGVAFWPWIAADALTAMGIISFVLCVIVAVQAMLLFSRFKTDLGPGDPVDAMPPMVSLWMWVATLAMMGANLNIVVAAPFLPDNQVGAYFAAQKTSQLLQLPILAINIVAAPMFARLYSQGKLAELQNVGRNFAKILVLPLVAGVLVLVVFAGPLLRLFDPAYVMASTALVILAASFLFAGLGGPTRQLMLMADGERDLVRLTIVSEVFGLALIPVLVPVFSIVGAALASAVSRVIFTILAVRWCRGQLGVDPSILSVVSKPTVV